MLIPVERFLSDRTWSYPTRLLLCFAEHADYVGNFARPKDLLAQRTLDWRRQAPLPYVVAFGERPPDYIELASCPGWCGDETCCGLIDQYVTYGELQRLARLFPGLDLQGKRLPEGIYALRQVEGRCVLFADGKCLAHDTGAKPLWCKLYVCDRMWRSSRAVFK